MSKYPSFVFDYAINTHVDKGTEKTLFILLTGKAFGYYNLRLSVTSRKQNVRHMPLKIKYGQ